jgi:hypothetical protein
MIAAHYKLQTPPSIGVRPTPAGKTVGLFVFCQDCGAIVKMEGSEPEIGALGSPRIASYACGDTWISAHLRPWLNSRGLSFVRLRANLGANRLQNQASFVEKICRKVARLSQHAQQQMRSSDVLVVG